MGTARRRYTEEFKLEAVGLPARSGRPLRQIARELGIAPSRLRAWRNKCEGGMRIWPPETPACGARTSAFTWSGRF